MTVGLPGQFRAVVTNGDTAAKDVTVTITVPESFGVAATDPTMVQEGTHLTYTGDLPPLSQWTFTVTVIPTTGGTFLCETDVTCKNALTPESVPHGEVAIKVFDPGPCAVVTVTNGGGDKFDCYDEGEFETLPNAGTGFDGVWLAGGIQTAIDDFQTYADGVKVTDTMEDGDHWAGNWRFS